MFDLVTGNKRVVQVVLAIIILPFAFFGIDSYFRGNSEAQVIATINEEPISVNEFSQVFRNVQNSMQSQLKDNPQMNTYFQSEDFKRSVLDDLIKRKLMLMFAEQNNMVIPDDLVTREIRNISAFHDESGNFATDRYELILKAQNLTPERFESEIRQSILFERIESSIFGGAFVSDDLLERLERIRRQERIVSQHIFIPAKFVGVQKIEESEIRKFYDDNKNNFMLPARVKVEYVLLTPEVISDSVTVSESEIIALYEARMDEYKTQEQRRASHILLTAGSEMDKTEKSEVEKRAQSLQSQLSSDPDLFNQMARKYSQDPGSAEQGGDLGFFEKGLMPKSFDDIVFELGIGQISPVIKTEYGYHVARVDEIKPSIITPFETVRSELLNMARDSRLSEEFAVASEEFGDLVYSQYDTLQPAVDRFNLTLFQSDWVSEFGDSGNPLLDKPKVLEAIFAGYSVVDRRNIEAVEVEPNQLLSARVVEHEDKALMDYERVKDQIKEYLTAEKASALAQSEAKSTLTRLQGGEPLALDWSKEQVVSILSRKGLHPEGIRAVFGADSKNLPSYAGIPADNGKFVIYKIHDIKEAGQDAIKNVSNQARQEINNMIGREQFKSFLSSLQEKADVRINDSYFSAGGD